MLFPRAKKSLGQNFLVSGEAAERIVGALGAGADDTVLEIGPGRGALTERLVGRVGKLLAVEFDRELVAYLRERFGSRDDFALVEADALDVEFCELTGPETRARVVANLPYNISTAILQRLIAQRRCISEMLLMLQREVVERITARAGERERGFLSVMVEAYCEAEALFDVPPKAFRPVPKVWSTVVRLRVRPRPEFEIEDEALFRNVVSAGFAQRRKTIQNNLRAAPEELRARVEASGGAESVLEKAAIEPRRRAETLMLGEWAALARAL